jgi:SAM-dependent methyltransferase
MTMTAAKRLRAPAYERPENSNRKPQWAGRFRPKSNWDTLAELDPLWTVLSDPAKKFGKWGQAEFFGTGKQEAERILAICESKGIRLAAGRALDFGCGVGRMTRAFSGRFSSCVGMDVSEKMLSLARRFNSDCRACAFLASDAPQLPFADGSFDFVFTVLVLQHLSKKRTILGYIGEFIRVAKDNGVIVFQLPNEVPFRRRMQIRRRLWWWLSMMGVPESWLFKSLGLAPILINGIARNEVERFVRSHGAKLVAVERYDPSEGDFHSYYYFLVKPANCERAVADICSEGAPLLK